ncbi:MAG: hypothetical protein A2X61_08860 [Ignavibacteria bacterium GWB2_35_12]|nr:MAG: hypothetical protein A2X63_04360 [Ignavibacteria bacterium GWA2_35_8]OGU40602.1 MAG: hypothetical protein A2X61_08860 [Ignavibacteria bacterium GWB2_35_12]OGU91666.1 MAG: hypothetical protein A2220_10510 [Ignavibacteria bacterium RIFOXYA2_FULL_35_10]OGV22636.1 MAG: hypothetical protein A2475_13055 [Ignavibacteria bacterium RIFOXYC2_FULL_35_21]
MSKAPVLKGKSLISILNKLGFEIIRIKGSHHFLKHQDGRFTSVPVHPGEEIGPGLLFKILNDCELTIEELKKYI